MDPRPARRPTLADVARIAGTSTTVVSYVVNGTNRPVAPATRERVRAAIAQLDYRPNRAARALRVRSQRFIGLVVPATADPFYVAFADEIQASAMRRGYLTLTGSSGFNPDQEAALLEGLVDEEAAGVILVGLGESRDLRAVLESSPVPAVFLHHRPAGLSGPLVTIADREWARRATEHLLGHGHTELALLTHADDDGPVGMRMRGFRDAVEAAGIEPSLWRTDGYDRQAASRAVMTALEGGAAVPRGLVVTTDELAFGALHALAAIFLGGMRPLGVGFAALAFGFFEALSIRLGNLDVPSQLVQTIPYIATLIGLGLFAWRETTRRRRGSGATGQRRRPVTPGADPA